MYDKPKRAKQVKKSGDMLHADVLKRFHAVYSTLSEDRERAAKDRCFVWDDASQWAGGIGEQFAKKTKITVNKQQLAVNRALSQISQNDVNIKFIAQNDDADDALSDFCAARFRADEQDSDADSVYRNALVECLSGGYGAVRLLTEYESNDFDDDDYQRIKIMPISDAESRVFFSYDRGRCWLITSIPADDYKELYNDDPADWPSGYLIDSAGFSWCSADEVKVCEYYEVEEATDEVVVFETLDEQEVRHRQSELDEDPEVLQELLSTGAREVRRREIKVKKVHKWLLSGAKVLEDCGYIHGEMIPVAMQFGTLVTLGGVTRSVGLTHHAHDAQRLRNAEMSQIASRAAESGASTPIVTPEQIRGHENLWADAPVKNPAVLLLNPILGPDGMPIAAPPLGFKEPSQLAPATVASMQMSDAALSELLGNQQDAETLAANTSGIAVRQTLQQLDLRVEPFMAGYAQLREWVGRIWLSMAREIYVEEGRRLKTLSPEGKSSSVTLSEMQIDDDGYPVIANDLSRARFSVVASYGPSSSSKREATVTAVQQLMGSVTDPVLLRALSLLAAYNLEGEGVGDFRRWARMQLVRDGVLQPTKQEAEKLAQESQNQQPDPQAQYLQAESQKAVALAGKAEADTAKALAETELKQAETAQLVAQLSREQQAELMAALQMMGVADQQQMQQQTQQKQIL